MLGDVTRIPGAAVTPLLPLAYYSVALGQILFWYHGGSVRLPARCRRGTIGFVVVSQ